MRTLVMEDGMDREWITVIGDGDHSTSLDDMVAVPSPCDPFEFLPPLTPSAHVRNGPTDDCIRNLEEGYDQVTTELEARGCPIPDTYRKLYTSQDILRRFRCNDGGAVLGV